MYLNRPYLFGAIVGFAVLLGTLMFTWFFSGTPEPYETDSKETAAKQTKAPQTQISESDPERRRDSEPVSEQAGADRPEDDQLRVKLKSLYAAEDIDGIGSALKNLSLEAAWSVWTNLFEEYQAEETGTLSSLLNLIGLNISNKLAREGDEATYEEIYRLVESGSSSRSLQARLVKILTDSGTSSAMETLINLATAVKDERIKGRVIEGISELPYRNTTDMESMVRTLEATWESDIDSPQLGHAVALAMARTGSRRSVSALYDVAVSSRVEDTRDWRVISARGALTNVRSVEGIAVLESGLESNDIGDPAFEVSGAALSRLGRVEATQALINWARTAPETADEVVERWVLQIKDGRSWDYIEEVLMLERTHFRSEAVAAAVERAYRTRQALVENSRNLIEEN